MQGDRCRHWKKTCKQATWPLGVSKYMIFYSALTYLRSTMGDNQIRSAPQMLWEAQIPLRGCNLLLEELKYKCCRLCRMVPMAQFCETEVQKNAYEQMAMGVFPWIFMTSTLNFMELFSYVTKYYCCLHFLPQSLKVVNIVCSSMDHTKPGSEPDWAHRYSWRPNSICGSGNQDRPLFPSLWDFNCGLLSCRTSSCYWSIL